MSIWQIDRQQSEGAREGRDGNIRSKKIIEWLLIKDGLLYGRFERLKDAMNAKKAAEAGKRMEPWA